MATVALQAEYEYYLAHKNEIVKQYDGKFVVLKGQQLLGAYDDEIEALRETTKTHKLGTFMVHKVSSHEDTQIFHSSVVFS